MSRLAVIGIASVVCSCASAQRTEFVESQAAEIAYPRPLEQVWPEVLAELTREGYVLEATPQPGVVLTQWREHAAGGLGGMFFTRYLVRGISLGDRCEIRAFAETRVSERRDRNARDPSLVKLWPGGAPHEEPDAVTPAVGRPVASRDRAFEWRMVQRLAPEVADELSALAARRYP